MYSDKWMNDPSIHKSSALYLTDNISLRYWQTENNQILGVCVDFDYADDFHYEFLKENWDFFLQNILHIDPNTDYLPLLKTYFQKTAAHLDFMTAVDEHRIEHRKVAFY